MTRRLLAINWEMPPLSGPRAVQVSRTLKHLVPLGWQSSVVCFGPRSGRYNQDFQLAARLRAPEGVTLVPVQSAEERFFFRALWRVVPPVKLLPDEKWVWIHPASRAACRLARADRFDALVSFGQPWSDHLIGGRVHRETGLPWIAHFSDPWVDSPYLHGSRWQQKIWRRMEANVIRQADALIFTNSQSVDRVMSKYPADWRRKSHVIPHGYDPADTVPHAPSRGSARLEIVHTGRFYEGVRTPEPLLRALASLAARRALAKELRVALVGTPVPAHQRLAASLGLGEVVEFVGRVPFAESARRAAQADVLLVIDAPAGESLFLPSKLVDYLPFDKPILALTPERGASADLVRRLAYPVVPPGDVPAIEAAIERLLNAKQESRLGPSGCHRSVAESYDIRRTAASFAEILARCT
jgi:glycosyltransferase involved in cell wall biosynthesis